PIEHGQAKFDLTLNIFEQNESLQAKFEYRSDLYHPNTIEQMVITLENLLLQVCSHPETLLHSLQLVDSKQQRELEDWNQDQLIKEFWTSVPITQVNQWVTGFEKTMIDPFLRQAQQQPNSCALISHGKRWSYQQLNQLSNALAHQLVDAGAGPEKTIAIFFDRNIQMIVSMLACLKSGSAYVPLDPAYPEIRLKQILQDCQATAIISDQNLNQCAWFNELDVKWLDINTIDFDNPSDHPTYEYAPVNTAKQNNVAYLIYTSGSTGKPKGVAIEHQQVLALLKWAQHAYTKEQLKGVLAATSICFDLSIFEIFVPLSAGTTIILAENVLELNSLPDVNEVTLLNTVPTAANELLRLNDLPVSINTVNLAGEALSAQLVQRLYSQVNIDKVFNLYGPSECTTYSTGVCLPDDIQDNAVVSIGLPIMGTQIEVLDSYGKPVPAGMCGELYIKGAGVARGYWNKKKLTREKFSLNDTSYQTGDRVRQRFDGQLEYLGRYDHQVKIRGFRIEAGDIESALEKHEDVDQAIVIVRKRDIDEALTLVAYVVFKNDSTHATKILRQHLAQYVPSYMQPSAIICLDSLPTLPNGKVDRSKLPQPGALTLSSEHTEPDSDDHIVNLLSSIWKTLLQLDQVPADTSFFELGGDSILAIQMIAQARSQGLGLHPRDIFQYPTLFTLSTYAKQNQAKVTINQEPVTGLIPLLPAQQWFFDQNLQYPEYWNQSLLLSIDRPLSETLLKQALDQLVKHYDTLRTRFFFKDGLWNQEILEDLPDSNEYFIFIKQKSTSLESSIAQISEQVQSSFILNNPPLWKLVYIELSTQSGVERRLLWVCHHLIVDGISWRLLLTSLFNLYQQLQVGQTPRLSAKTHSIKDWMNFLEEYDFQSQLTYWKKQCDCSHEFSLDKPEGNQQMCSQTTLTRELDKEITYQWLNEVPVKYSIKSDELLIIALMQSLFKWSKLTELQIVLESHGRDAHKLSIENNIDLSDTIGWLTAMYPLVFTYQADHENDPGELIKLHKAKIRSIPDQGIGYGVLRWTGDDADSELLSFKPNVRFNYFGQGDSVLADSSIFHLAKESTGHARHPENLQDVKFDINAFVINGRLKLHWNYSTEQYFPETIQTLMDMTLDNLDKLVEYCIGNNHDRGLIAEDFPEMDIDNRELDELLDNI
ncbi:MAG: amino acid adenylation domain-containing protein, partial [Pseudomonadota bacterium]